MADKTSDALKGLTIPAVLALGARRLRLDVPVGRTRMIELLPLIQTLADAVVDSAEEAYKSQGLKITCAKGCGACCTQLVPLAAFEARYIRDLIEEMAEPRRSVVKARFSEARRKLEEAGWLDRLLDTKQLESTNPAEFGEEYKRLGIVCPFLEDQSCSIHPSRPIICREYLVTSRRKYCATASFDKVKRVALPGYVFLSMLSVAGEMRGARKTVTTLHSDVEGRDVSAEQIMARWVPMIVALEWADAHPDESTPKPGTVLIQDLYDTLAGRRPVA